MLLVREEVELFVLELDTEQDFEKTDFVGVTAAVEGVKRACGHGEIVKKVEIMEGIRWLNGPGVIIAIVSSHTA